MSEDKLILEEYGKMINNYDKLNFNSAKELYNKICLVEDPKIKKKYMDELINGTLYVVYNYIKRNDLDFLCSSVYGMDDIINSFNEAWISKIYNGALNNVENYSFMFNIPFINDVIDKLGEKQSFTNDYYLMSNLIICDLFIEYNGLRESNKNIVFDDFIDSYFEKHNNLCNYNGKYYKLEELFDKMNSYVNNRMNDNFSNRKFINFLKLIVSNCMYDELDDSICSYDMEDDIINKVFYESFGKDINSVLLNDRIRYILYRRYGFDDGNTHTFEEIGKDLNLSIERVRQIEKKHFDKLRYNMNIKKYNNID